jgi:hypothetical protein
MTEDNWADKRDSARIPTQLKVLGAMEGEETLVQGDVSIGGARARLPYIPAVVRVSVQLDTGLVIPGEFYSVRPSTEGGADVIIRFRDLPLDVEMKLARFIDDAALKGIKSV